MENNTTQKQQATGTFTRRDIHQQVTDTIIWQLEAGTIPWLKPWKGDDNRSFSIPKKISQRVKNTKASISCFFGARH